MRFDNSFKRTIATMTFLFMIAAIPAGKADIVIAKENEAKEHDDSYERFLRNEEKVHIDSKVSVGKKFSLEYADGKDCTLREIIDSMVDYLDADDKLFLSRIDCVQYAYLDCGNDGNEELALRFFVNANELIGPHMIIKNTDGQLKTVYFDDDAQDMQFIESGIIYCYDSDRYGAHCDYEEYIDEDGNLKYICSTKYVSFFNTPGERMDINNTPDDPEDDIYSFEYTPEAEFDTFGADDVLVSCSDFSNLGIKFRSDKTKVDLRMNDTKKFNVVKTYLSGDKKVKFCTSEQAEKIRISKEEKCGITEEMRKAPTVIWNNFDYKSFYAKEKIDAEDVDYSVYDELIEAQKEIAQNPWYVCNPNAGYYITDVDKDGVKELIFGGDGSFQSEEGCSISEMYTIRNGKPFCVLSNGNSANNVYWLCEGNTIRHTYYFAYDSYGDICYKYRSGELTVLEELVHSCGQWYYSSKDYGEDDIELTDEEAGEYSDKFERTYKAIDYKFTAF
ncbi:MAG: hypothetical protein J5802_10895 [Butyrivibrio sp.]|nr:hypothetical protein [Butyrivibrio sp.]